MSLILAGIQGISIYLDDVVVHAPTTALHDDRLEQVFRQIPVTLLLGLARLCNIWFRSLYW